MTPHVLTPVPPTREQAPAPGADPQGAGAARARHWSPTVGVLGLGYVGLPTGLAATAAGLDVIGIDVSEDRLRRIRAREVDLLERDHDRLAAAQAAGTLRTTASVRALSRADVVLICVPTPVHEDRRPDLRPLRAACESVVRHARAGQTIILTSTSYVGTTAELLVAPLRERGLVAGEDVHVAFSPERIDPGNTAHTQEQTPRVVGGATDLCAERAAAVLGRLTERIHRVSSMEAAELTKLMENTFRAVNIAFAYEMADAAAHYGLDPIEVTEAAATKPYGFLAFYPGAGVGGHCIPCDPHYLLEPLHASGAGAPIIEQAMGAIAERPRRVAARACELLGDAYGKRVLVAGVTYKPGVQDVREAPALEVLAALEREGCEVGYYDPLVPTLRLGARTLHSQLHPRGADWDLVVVATLHPGWDYGFLDSCPQLLDATYRIAAGYGPATV